MVILLSAAVCLLGLTPALAQGSWATLQEYEKATGKKIEKFSEAPMLKTKVAAGILPPVEERLPQREDIYVLEPIEEIGRYGGTARTTTLQINSYGSDSLLMSWERLVKPTPDGTRVIPHLAKKVESSEDKTTWTFYLRRGVKWSDGYPFTADDIMFWYEDVLLNKELTPAISAPMKTKGGLVKVKKIDDYTVQFKFPDPHPYFVNRLAHGGGGTWHLIIPKHYMKQFHPKYANKEKLEKEIKERGFDHWYELFWDRNANWEGQVMNTERPTLAPYMLVKKTSDRRIYERNPYYWKVDTAGNQLPYFDKIVGKLATNKEVVQGMIMSGEVDFVGFAADIRNYPMYKQYEEKGGYRTILWKSGYGCQVVYFVNLTHKDPILRKIFQDVRFRRALSLAINREEINDTIYYGKAAPRQYTVLESSKYFEPEFAKAYIEYNPEKAKELLDEMGLIDKDGDGWRERPDGKRLTFTIEYAPAAIPTAVTPNVELVTRYWQEIGIDVRAKQISGELQSRRATGNLMDATAWCDGSAVDILFPIDPRHVVPTWPRWEECTFTEWSRWFNTDGKEGMEPPAEIKQLRGWWDKMQIEPSEHKRIELGKKILALQAEKLWAIGTIGKAPRPVIVSKNIGNFPEHGFWAWGTGWTSARDPEQFFFKK